jgi:hypothetical protein
MAGSEQHFVTYYPAIMAAGLIAGVPAAIGVPADAMLVVWLSLIPSPVLHQTHVQILKSVYFSRFIATRHFD